MPSQPRHVLSPLVNRPCPKLKRDAISERRGTKCSPVPTSSFYSPAGSRGEERAPKRRKIEMVGMEPGIMKMEEAELMADLLNGLDDFRDSPSPDRTFKVEEETTIKLENLKSQRLEFLGDERQQPAPTIDQPLLGLEDDSGIETWQISDDDDATMANPRAQLIDETFPVKQEEAKRVKADREVKREEVGEETMVYDQVDVEERLRENATLERPTSVVTKLLVKSEAMNPRLNDEYKHALDLDLDLDLDLAFDPAFELSPSPPSSRTKRQTPLYPILHPLVHPPGMECLNSPRYEETPWARCVVKKVESEEGGTSRWGWSDKTILVKDVRRHHEYRLTLTGEYSELPLEIGDIVNVVSTQVVMEESTKSPVKSRQLPALLMASLVGSISPTIDGSSEIDIQPENQPRNIVFSHKHPENHIIVHPDVLLPMTSLAGALSCRRKPLIQRLVKESSAQSKPLLYGNIIHELLQSALLTRQFDTRSLKASLDEIINRPGMQMDVWGADVGLEELRGEVWEKVMMGVGGFGEKWVGAEPQPTAQLHDSMSTLSISGLHDIEESIFSPKWGMRGKVDASVQISLAQAPEVKQTGRYRHSTMKAGLVSVASKVFTMPFEIKTGRAVGVMEHRAQTMLYTLLMEERYRTSIKAGLLYYTQTDSLLQVPAASSEIRSLLHARNELAGYLAHDRAEAQSRVLASQNTPQVPVLPQERSGKIEAPTSTAASPVTHASHAPSPESEQVSSQHAILPPTLDNPRECRSCYAVNGCMLYRKALDAVAGDDPISELYEKKTGHLSEDHAAFFRKWEHLVSVEEQDMVRFKNQLWTMTAQEREKTGRCFSDMIIAEHIDERGISIAKIHQHSYRFVRSYALHDTKSLLNGHISKGDPVSLSIEPDLISIARGFVLDLTPTEVKIGTNLALDEEILLERTGRFVKGALQAPTVFRIDKDEMMSGTARMRNNLAQLFYPDDANGDAKRRSLIVDLHEPEFEDVWAPDAAEIPAHLNVDQQEAMRKVLTAKDYALILGMPGTGKTTTIAEIITALVNRGKSVLLTSYTHSAVDTILMKLVNTEHKMLRLGNFDKVHPDVAHLTLEAMEPTTSLSQLEARMMSPQIVATTCLSIDHPLFSRRKFDYCIIDEASQITLPTCIGPLRFADTFVLVGDHFQLPPIVRNPQARRGGLDVSLFRLLSDAYPSAVVELAHQYRMNEDIMLLSNRLIYGERLKCGSDGVAQQILQLPLDPVDVYGSQMAGSWLAELLSPIRKAVFVDTDSISARDSRVGDLVQNEIEGTLVHQLTSALIACGVKQEDIGVITPYRQQIKLISGLMKELRGVEILTSDKSQGRDKDCIVISMVRSNELGNIGDLLRDWRRINVSFTRAKKKLVIFGSRSTLEKDRLLADFLDLMQGKDWIYKLPPLAHEKFFSVFPVLSQSVPSPPLKRQTKGHKLSEDIIASRPFIRDALNDITNLNDAKPQL